MALRIRSKRARPQASPSSAATKLASGDDLPPTNDAASLPDEEPRRKRALVTAANLRFLEKMPPLRDYQRGPFGRRGGVDGGAPSAAVGSGGSSSLWMRALEQSMEETSFVTREASTRAALVAPIVPVGATNSSRNRMDATAEAEARRRRRLAALQTTRGGGKDDEARPATEGLAL
ncbi:hypothetical protein BBJ28_00014946 [Nothophytophthora sp. Chile5]|nr:hypothetical protein BBJ28_00014946 [Nothophytophthora sp. Chile5]